MVVPEAKARSPDVNTVMSDVNTVVSDVKGARGSEIRTWPVVTNSSMRVLANPSLRVLVRCVGGMFLSVVRAEGPKKKKC